MNAPRLSAFFFSLVLLLTCSASVSAAGNSGTLIIKNRDLTRVIVSTGDDNNKGLNLLLNGTGELKAFSETQSYTASFSSGSRPVKISLYPSLLGFFPDRVEIQSTESEFDLISSEVFDIDSETPLDADIGHIIFSDFAPRGGHDWEVYRWNLYPDILIFDTWNYEAQARLFKRLAFFVEKPGFVGTIVSNEGLEGRHGWNAHDYRPEDLADFFNMAMETPEVLNSEEIYLRDLLVSEGILNVQNEKYSGGKGAVLSVSRESLPDWRYRFLTHECLHGIFFSDPDFRAQSERIFFSMHPDEITFWKKLLDYRGYDVSNDYLLVNEFMAYILQQPFEDINDYFKTFLYVRMTSARPYEAGFVETFERNYPDSFINSTENMSALLYSKCGRTSGHLSNLIPGSIGDGFFNLFPVY